MENAPKFKTAMLERMPDQLLAPHWYAAWVFTAVSAMGTAVAMVAFTAPSETPGSLFSIAEIA